LIGHGQTEGRQDLIEVMPDEICKRFTPHRGQFLSSIGIRRVTISSPALGRFLSTLQGQKSVIWLPTSRSRRRSTRTQ
jgi:hypothetical protein